LQAASPQTWRFEVPIKQSPHPKDQDTHTE